MGKTHKLVAYYAAMLVFLVFFTHTLEAQINIGGNPFSFRHEVGGVESIPIKQMPPLNRSEIDKEDQKDNQAGLPPRFGYAFPVAFNLKNSGAWTTLDNGDRIWRLTLSSPGAMSINLTYNAFWLPEGATYYIYNENRDKLIGGFSSRNNNSPKGQSIGFATGLIFSDRITLEYYEPKTVAGQGEIAIDQVVHGYRTLHATDAADAFGDSGACEVNVNCSPEGDNWQVIKNSVAMIIVGGNRWCTGSLVISTVQDFKPYFLTANHCLDGWAIPVPLNAATNPMAGNWMFVWRYESADCNNPTTEPTLITTSGAILAANHVNSDFALFRLIESPTQLNPSIPLWYNGWDATGAIASNATGIHHPSGDIKKISVENDALVSTNYSSTSSNASGNHWMVADWDAGVTEGGSSGSPLYDPAQRVIGQLHGGSSACDMDGDNDSPDWYGKFSVSWNGANQRERLHDWLDPDCPVNRAVNTNFNLGVEAIYASNEITSTSDISGTVLVDYSAGKQIRLLPNFKAAAGVLFNARIGGCGPMLTPPDPSQLSRSIAGAGSYVLPDKSIAMNEARSTGQQAEETFKCYPNPFSNELFVHFVIAQASTRVTLSLSDALGRQVQEICSKQPFEAGRHSLYLKYEQLPAGVYYLTLNTQEGLWVQKLVKNE